ncbi:hypothetical protein F2Q70_00040464, partial [Brassica cretica]
YHHPRVRTRSERGIKRLGPILRCFKAIFISIISSNQVSLLHLSFLYVCFFILTTFCIFFWLHDYLLFFYLLLFLL